MPHPSRVVSAVQHPVPLSAWAWPEPRAGAVPGQWGPSVPARGPLAAGSQHLWAPVSHSGAPRGPPEPSSLSGTDRGTHSAPGSPALTASPLGVRLWPGRKHRGADPAPPPWFCGGLVGRRHWRLPGRVLCPAPGVLLSHPLLGQDPGGPVTSWQLCVVWGENGGGDGPDHAELTVGERGLSPGAETDRWPEQVSMETGEQLGAGEPVINVTSAWEVASVGRQGN